MGKKDIWITKCVEVYINSCVASESKLCGKEG